MSGLAIWITGLPGSGKSSIAEALKRLHPEFLILRMDELRKVVTPQPTYSVEEREIVYRALVFFAKTLAEAGHNVLIDATGNLRTWRDFAREMIPRYKEVYLQCPVDVCMERESTRKRKHAAPENIYEKGKAGWPVPGIGVPYEEPLIPDLVIDADKMKVEDIANVIDKEIISS